MKRWKMRKLVILPTVLAVGIGVSACHPKIYKPVTVDHRGEAGAVLLSVNSTIPWSEAAALLEPKFSMVNGDAALSKVVRSTAVIRQQVLDSFGVGLGVGLPQTSSTSSSQTTTDLQTVTIIGDDSQSENQTTTTQKNTSETSEKKPGVAPDAPSTTHPDALPQPIDKQSEVGIDPYLEYKAAQSLYQSVKLLNMEVRNAAIREGYVPHVVMLKLTPMLYRRDLSYDIYAKVSFFSGDEGQSQPKLPYVVPILATDNLERAIKSKSVEISRQIGLALNAMVKGIGVNADLNTLNRNLDAIEASDFNSLLTVGRLTDNSLYIRLGAANQATARFATIGKTYDIAVLVLVPQEYYKQQGKGAKLSVISHTELRNAFTGEPLNDVPENVFLQEIDNSFRSVLKVERSMLEAWEKKDEKQKIADALNLSEGIQKSDWKLFQLDAKNITLGNKNLSDLRLGYLRSLWVRLAGNMANGSFKGASVELRPIKSLKVPAQTVVLRDHGKKGMEVVLRNVTGARPGRVTARLEYASGNEFPAETITIVPDAQLLRLRFVSPKPWKLDPAGSTLFVKAVECDWAGAACPKNDEQAYSVVYLPVPTVPSAPPEPKLRLRRTLKVIVSDKGKGGVTLFIDNLKEDGVALTVEGARITGAKDNTSKTTIVVSKQRVIMSANGGVDLTLDNLRPGVKATAIATGLKKDLKTKKLTPTGSKKVEFEVVKAE